jgi:hypothetical protein
MAGNKTKETLKRLCIRNSRLFAHIHSSLSTGSHGAFMWNMSHMNKNWKRSTDVPFYVRYLTMLLVSRLYCVNDRKANKYGAIGGIKFAEKPPHCHYVRRESHMI